LWGAGHFFGTDRRRWRAEPADRIEQEFWPLPGRRRSLSCAGFDYDAEPPPNPTIAVAAPHWALVLGAGALPATRV
jgi:hypothetical protein